MCLYSVKTSILVVGRDVSSGLRPFFLSVNYGSETVTYAETVGEGRTLLRSMRPAVLLIGVPCGVDKCETAKSVVALARRANPDVRVIAVGEDPECATVDALIPWPASSDQIGQALEEQMWLNAVAQNGYRGHVQ